MKKFILFIMLIFCAVFAVGANVYVTHDGNNTAPYDSEERASTSIQVAFDYGADGDTVWIKHDRAYDMNGTDQAAADVNIDHNEITIKGYYLSLGDMSVGGAYYKDSTNGWTIIDANLGFYSIFSIGLVNNVVIENIKFVDVNGSASGGVAGIRATDAIGKGGIEIRNCWLTGGSYGIQLCESVTTLVMDCWFTGDYYHATKGAPSDSGPIRVNTQTYGTKIIGNYFEPSGTNDNCIYDFGTWGTLIQGNIFNISGTMIYAIRCKETAGAMIINNTIYDNGTLTNGIQLDSGLWGATIYNNIIWGATNDINDASSANTYQDYNCYSGNSETHGVSSDPLFMNAANGDFRLKPTSPCLNTGLPTLGNEMTNLGYTDIGAWQRISYLRFPK